MSASIRAVCRSDTGLAGGYDRYDLATTFLARGRNPFFSGIPGFFALVTTSTTYSICVSNKRRRGVGEESREPKGINRKQVVEVVGRNRSGPSRRPQGSDLRHEAGSRQ
jgi:hypothetical protein